MHYLAFVLIPAEGNSAEHVERIMALYRERDDDSDAPDSGFWDWYQIGGRWTGYLSGYDPEIDPRNRDPFGGGIKWPTQWVRHGGDVQPARVALQALSSKGYPFALISHDAVLLHRVWDGETFSESSDHDAKVRAALEAHDGRVVVVDYHS